MFSSFPFSRLHHSQLFSIFALLRWVSIDLVVRERVALSFRMVGAPSYAWRTFYIRVGNITTLFATL
jgi:hypothetical protein